jgi:hypothetical protein
MVHHLNAIAFLITSAVEYFPISTMEYSRVIVSYHLSFLLFSFLLYVQVKVEQNVP